MGFDNRAFWNQRYEEDSWLGSGPGSRGLAAAYKGELLRPLLKSGIINSLLDVGCGDCCWINEFDDWIKAHAVDYLGLDISEVAITKNRNRLPSLNFEVFDLLSSNLPTNFDLVLCFDVLIHQCDENVFITALRKLISSIAKYGLISYATPGLTEPILPTIADPAVLRNEQKFQERVAAQVNTIRTAEVQIFGDLVALVRDIDQSIQICPLGHYRYQTIYKLIRSGNPDFL